MAYWQAGDWAYYGASIAAILLWLDFLRHSLPRLPGHSARIWLPLSLCFGTGSALIWVGGLKYYDYFGGLPSEATFRYVFDEPLEASSVVTDAIDGGLLTMLLAAFAGFVLAWRLHFHGQTAMAAPRRARRWSVLALLLPIALMLTENASLHGATMVPGANFAFVGTRAVWSAVWSGTKSGHTLRAAKRPALPKLAGDAPVNVLLIVAESLRADAPSFSGNLRPTTPNMDRFLERFPGQSFVFEHFYSNATLTHLSYASLLSGEAPSSGSRYLHAVPLLFDYAKAYPGTRTFCISSQAYRDHNFRGFLQSPSLEYLFSSEDSGLLRANDRFIDDRHVTERFDAWLNSLPEGTRFLGVLHFFGTHSPYKAPKAFRRWAQARSGSRNAEYVPDRGKYHDSVRYFDQNVGDVLDTLEARGLLEDTAILFTSDHGEAFREHDVSGHVSIRAFYEETIHIPFWMYVPQRIAPETGDTLRKNAAHNASNLDIVPTVVDLLKLRGQEQVDTIVDRLPGRSLLRPLPSGRTIVTQNLGRLGGLATGFAMIRGSVRTLFHPEDPMAPIAIYDLASDPEQRINLWPALSPTARDEVWRDIGARYPERQERIRAKFALPQ